MLRDVPISRKEKDGAVSIITDSMSMDIFLTQGPMIGAVVRKTLSIPFTTVFAEATQQKGRFPKNGLMISGSSLRMLKAVQAKNIDFAEKTILNHSAKIISIGNLSNVEMKLEKNIVDNGNAKQEKMILNLFGKQNFDDMVSTSNNIQKCIKSNLESARYADVKKNLLNIALEKFVLYLSIIVTQLEKFVDFFAHIAIADSVLSKTQRNFLVPQYGTYR